MNLFILSMNYSKCAKLHCDKHCVKMILEITQLLYTAWWYGRTNVDWAECEYDPYKSTHKNHPCAIWVRNCENNYNWALNLGLELCKEYQRRYNKTHKCYYHLLRLKDMGYPELVEKETHTPNSKKRAYTKSPEGCQYFDCAINDEYFETCAVYDSEGVLDCVKSYRNYYKMKNMEMKWNKGHDDTPDWYGKELYN